MAEPRKVPFVTISTFNTSPATPESSKKRRREDEAIDITFGKDGDGGGGAAAAVGSGGGGGGGRGGSGSGPFGNVNAAGGDAEAGEAKPTVRLHLPLSEPSDRGSSEFNYGELVNTSLTQVKLAGSTVPKGLAPPLDPSDPFADADRERREVEAMAKKFESKYSVVPKKKKKDRMQDLIDIGYGYDDTDPFIDNSEAYDELVPASLTTKHGGFYINTGTLQFRAASESEGENAGAEDNRFKKTKDGEERVIKKRRKKQEGGILEEKKPRKNKVPKAGVSALNVHRPEKKKRKKLMKDSIHLANMLRRFTREKEEMRKRNVAPVGLPRPAGGTAAAAAAKVPNATNALHNAQSKAAGGNECNMADLAADQAVLSMLGSTNNDILQDMMGDLDFEMLDSPQPSSPLQGENGSFAMGHKAGGGRLLPGNVMAPPPLPGGLPAPLAKRIEDLRSASRLFDAEGRKKFFTLDMNNILLDIELQVQEQPTEVRAVVYSHLEAFVPCNKEALLKRLKKLSLNIQDDRLRTPLLKLKLAVCSVMPEQIARYNMDCIAKVAKQQSGEGEKNGSEDDDEEKPGKRVMGPRKKFVWDDKLRLLLCNLVRVKLGCYELEGKNSLSLEDYLKAFMETEVKLLWPKGWMQARMLFKESIMAHGHLTGYTAKKRMVTTPKAKPKEAMWVQRSVASAGATPSPAGQAAKRPPQSPSEPICLDSLDEDLTAPSLDSISQALAILGNAAKGLAHGDPPSPDGPKAAAAAAAAKPSSLHVLPLIQQQQQQQKKNSVSAASSNSPHYISTSSSISTSLSRPLSVTPLSRPLSVTSTPPSRPLSVTSTPPSRPLSVTSSSTPLSRPLSVTSSSTPLSRPLSVTSTPLSRPLSVTSTPLSRPLSVTSPSLSRTLSVTSTPLSRTLSVTSTPLSRPLSVTSASLSRPLSVTSTSLSRPLSVTSAPLPSMRPDGMGVIKGASQSHRHSVLNTQRTLVVGVAKANMLASAAAAAAPKPRPPPTASPLVAPGSKAASPGSKAGAPTSGLLKGSNNKANSGDTLIITSPPPRPHTLITSPHMLAKTFQMPRLPHNPPTKSSPSLTQTLPGVQPRPQSNFITPMHATLTKSAHSSIPPIVKLTPRTLNHAATTTATTSPSVSISPRSQANPPMHQYSPKSAAGFRSAFSGAQGGATKQGQGSYTPPGSQKTPNNNNNNSSSSSTTNASLINTISISKHSGSSASPTIASANQGQRQRPGGGTPQGAKPVASVPASSVSSQLPQVSTAGGGGGGSLLGSASSLPLGFGMLGGLVPVSLPFQFPQLLNLPPLGTAGSSSAAGGSAASSNASFSTLTQNLYKSLQSGSQVALPPHLQLAFSDVSQSQGGDAKRKTL